MSEKPEISLAEFCLPNAQKRSQYAQEFQRVFGKRLKPYWCNLTGFDVLKFDKDIGTPEGDSLHEFVVQEYGKEAGELLHNLIAPAERN